MQVIVSLQDLVSLLPPPSDSLCQVVLPPSGPVGEALGGAAASSPGMLGRLEDLVYVIYTSGSTGMCSVWTNSAPHSDT